jgi:tetratricopeptide (TPR) repeat protein
VIQLSDDALDEKARQSFYALSIFSPKPNTFSEDAAVFVTQNSAESLDTLYDYGLLEMGENGRYTLHQVINDYAQIKFTDITAFDRMTEYFIGLGEGHESDYNILDPELTNVFAALQSTVYRNLPQIFAHLANLYYKFLEARGYYDLAEATAPQALAAAQVVSDLREQQFAYLHLGRLSYRRGEYKQAANHFYAGLLIAYDRKDASCALDLLANFGGAVANVGDVDIARRQILDGLAMARSYGEPGSIMKLLGVIGSIEANDGNYDLAEGYLRESLNLARQQGNGYEVTQYLTNLGALIAKRGAYSEAKPYFLEALELAKFKGEYENEFIAYSYWLSSAFAAQDYSFIEQTLPKAIKSAYRASMHQSLASLLVTILKITSVWTLEDPKSEKYLQDALPLARYFGDSSILLSILIRLGNISKNRGGFEEARDFFKESLSIAEELQEIDQIAELEKFLGLMEANLNNYDAAKNYWEKTLTYALDKAQTEQVYELLNALTNLAYHNEVYLDAENYLKQGLDLAYEKEDKETAIKFLMNLASVSFFTKDHTTAEEYFNQAIDLAKNIQNTELLGLIYFKSGILYAKHDQLDKAILRHEAALSLAKAEARYDLIANTLFSLYRTVLRKGVAEQGCQEE